MNPGDGVVFYSPKVHFSPKIEGKKPTTTPKAEQIRAFTALGTVEIDAPYPAEDMPAGFWRRNVKFEKTKDAPISALMTELEFTKSSSPTWGLLMRRGFFEISKHDFEAILSQMITN